MRCDKVDITRDVAIMIERAFNVINYTTFRRQQRRNYNVIEKRLVWIT